MTKREKNRRAFALMIKERGLSQPETASQLHCSIDTIKAWLKPETSKSSLPVPAWAPELLEFKVPPHPDKAGWHKDERANPAIKPIKRRTAR